PARRPRRRRRATLGQLGPGLDRTPARHARHRRPQARLGRRGTAGRGPAFRAGARRLAAPVPLLPADRGVTMPTVENTVTDAAGNAVAGAVIKIDLIAGPVLAQPGYTATTTIGPSLLINADSLGHWSVTLAGNADLTPANTYYRIIEAGYVSYVVVPTSGGPYSPQSLLVAPATPASVAISGVQVATDGVVAGTRPEINLISGAGAGLSAADNPGANRVDVTVTASGGGGGSGTPSTTVVSETSYGQAAVAGSAITYSRGDHTHGSPALTAATPAAETPG